MLIIKILSIIAFIGSIAWFISSRDYEPAIGIATSLSALIAVFMKEKRRAQESAQHQRVGKSGVGIQAGGNISIGNLHTQKEKEENAE